MSKQTLGISVVEAAKQRIKSLYTKKFDRPVVAFSGGKDATVLLELTVAVATELGRLPVDVAFMDTELLTPPTFDYVLRTSKRKELNFKWFAPFSATPNVFDRERPFWWTFDPLRKDDWIHKPPAGAVYRGEMYLRDIIAKSHFPFKKADNLVAACDHCGHKQPVKWKVAEKKCARCGKTFPMEWPKEDEEQFQKMVTGDIFKLMGVRADESPSRRFQSAAWKSFLDPKLGYDWTREAWPIYDWTAKDVWTVIAAEGWDYNTSYDSYVKAGWKKNELRVGDMTTSAKGAETLAKAFKLWPDWGEKVRARIPGASKLKNSSTIMPSPKDGETWEDFFARTCLASAPAWIVSRAKKAAVKAKATHSKHSETALPDEASCDKCGLGSSSWKALAGGCYHGDVFALSMPGLKELDPLPFRALAEAEAKKAAE